LRRGVVFGAGTKAPVPTRGAEERAPGMLMSTDGSIQAHTSQPWGRKDRQGKDGFPLWRETIKSGVCIYLKMIGKDPPARS